jgi:hypothetical protein
VWEGPSRINGKKAVAIVTMKSVNAKTGNMPQVWFFAANKPPTEAARLGHDEAVCGDCAFRPYLKKERENDEAGCYVTLIHGPNQIWKGWKAGAYPAMPKGLQFDRPVRIGSYGDPATVPLRVLRQLAARCVGGWTGYTHQWRRFPGLRSICMASVNSEAEQALAVGSGWRTFRVIQANDYFPKVYESRHFGFTSDGRRQEIECPGGEHDHNGTHYKTGEHTTCDRCRICDGRHDGFKDLRKNIVVHAH